MKIELKKILQKNYSFEQKDWELTEKFFLREKISAKFVFLEEGKIQRRIGFLISGLMRSHFLDERGEDATSYFFTPGKVVIAIESFNKQTPSLESISALEDSELLTIGYNDMQNLVKEVPLWEKIRKDVAEKKFQLLNERSKQFQTMSAAERYSKFLESYPEIHQKVALKHIASFLGIDIATLSRIRKNISK